ncbi:maleylacetoacetate isomerase [Cognatishimia activa]|uniref:Maleylacetoacetate isomerase n=1 Tax=Cognatishimia activa TaxID=1715691 RepID=A0A975ERJ9_9RHOB|nr:maleylacetoacetate isomerase [Cognatishimia activa]QTN36829.1 maleylacetoacetate isomerase [Cognatishimia activa]
MTETVLWDYPKSSASYRLRIALNLLGESYRIETVNLLDGSHRGADHLARNPQGLVPVLDIDGQRLTQSLAILDYLNETRDAGFLPQDSALRATTRALAMSLAVDVHPVCNLSVMKHATGGEEPARTDWMHHFIAPGLRAFEALLGGFPEGDFVNGETPGLAEICLIPQLYNANRWGVPYEDCPRIQALETACGALPAFQDAHPDKV